MIVFSLIVHSSLFPQENLSVLVMDVKVGKAAFATTEEKAQALAHTLVNTCFGLGIKAVALITSMNEPLGRAVGNSLEVAEAISCLNGKGPEDLKELVCEEGKLNRIPTFPYNQMGECHHTINNYNINDQHI